MKFLYLSVIFCFSIVHTFAQDFNDVDGFYSEDGQTENKNFNKLRNDSTPHKEIPRGIRAWTIDRKFGDIRPAEVDTLPHLYMNTIFNTGIHGEYNTTGNNYTARQNRLFMDRPLTEQFIFTQPYSFTHKSPDEIHFTNTLSPHTNVSYDNCGDKLNGEDHLGVWFAVNAGKRLGLGFDIDYSYARGYYSNQSTSHFKGTLMASYIGDRYQMHAAYSNYHEKVSENGGITNDEYIVHPEIFTDKFATNEIPTTLESNWNRNNSSHFFLTHRYSVGFYRLERLSDEEMKAKEFAMASKQENLERKMQEEQEKGEDTDEPSLLSNAGETAPTINDSLVADTMKRVYVPVTSFIHTLEWNSHDRIYQAYSSPNDYYQHTYFDAIDDNAFAGDSIYDQTKYTSIKNTLGIALLEGFNKYAKAGLKVFASHELRRFKLPEITQTYGHPTSLLANYNENSVSIGGQINKTQGNTLHYNLLAETWVAGEDFGQLKIDFDTDINFKLFGDTVTLKAKAYFYRLHPTFYQRRYHAKHFWWDNNNLSKETRTRIEGLFSYRKTKTRLRIAIEEIQNYTYFSTRYDMQEDKRINLSAGINQYGDNLNIMTAQLMQDFKLGPLHWDNVLTYQNSSNKDVLPLPTLNIYTNLYLKFKIVNELAVELGADAFYFTEYEAPDFCPQINQFAVQENQASRVKLGGYPFVDVYANMHLKHARFFVMYSHVNAGKGNKNYFLVPHYPQNGSILRMGVSWNFFN